MTRLEYRLVKEDGTYPAIYHVNLEKQGELFCRRNCEFQILNGKKYENVGGAKEPSGLNVLYLKEVEGFFYPNLSAHKEFGIEIRQYAESGPQEEMEFLPFQSHLDLLETLDNSYLYFNKKEFERVSAEFDQERKVYVLYMKPTGIKLS